MVTQVRAQSSPTGLSSASPRAEAPAPPLVNGNVPALPGSQACTPRLVVRVDVAAEVSGCPTDVEVAAWVDELASEHVAISASQHDPNAVACASQTAPRQAAQEVLVRVELAPAELSGSLDGASGADHIATEPQLEMLPQLAAFVVLPPAEAHAASVAPNTAAKVAPAPTTQPMRTLVQRVTCDELLRVAALSISLLVNLEPLPDVGTRTETFATSELGPSPETLATVAVPPTVAPPSDVSPIPPTVAEASAMRAQSPLGFVLGIRGAAGGGLNPGFNLGADGFVGIGIDPWWLEVYASYASSAKGSIVRDAGLAGSVRSRTLELAILPCRRWTNGYQVCVEGGYVMFAAEGRGFDSDKDDNLNFWGAGGQGSYSWPLLGAFWANLGLAILVPLSRVDMRVSGVAEPVWQMPMVTARGAFGLEWR